MLNVILFRICKHLLIQSHRPLCIFSVYVFSMYVFSMYVFNCLFVFPELQLLH